MNLGESVLDEAHKGLRIIEPSRKSKEVALRDLWRVFKDATKIKLAMLNPFPGKYPKAAAISHCQIEAEDPLRFFVIDRDLGWFFGNRILPTRTIINPKLIWHGKYTTYSREGCMSFPDRKVVKIPRWQIVEVEYWTFFGKRRRKFYEFRSFVFQHELDHFDQVCVYDLWEHKRKDIHKLREPDVI